MLYINERKKELLQLVSKLQYEIHGFEDVGYDFLEKDEIFISIHNEIDNVQLAMQIGEKNIIFFGGGSFDFKNDEEGFNFFLKNVTDIISNELKAITISNTTMTDIILSSNDVDENTDRNKILKCFINKKYNLKKLKKAKTEVKIYSWAQGIEKTFYI